MRYFGDPLDAPVYEEIERGPTPVGRECRSCRVPIDAEDRGFLIPDMTSLECGGGTHAYAEAPWHRICLMENVLGPMAGDLERRLVQADQPPT